MFVRDADGAPGRDLNLCQVTRFDSGSPHLASLSANMALYE